MSKSEIACLLFFNYLTSWFWFIMNFVGHANGIIITQNLFFCPCFVSHRTISPSRIPLRLRTWHILWYEYVQIYKLVSAWRNVSNVSLFFVTQSFFAFRNSWSLWKKKIWNDCFTQIAILRLNLVRVLQTCSSFSFNECGYLA